MDTLTLNTSDYLGKMVGEWIVAEIQNQSLAYVIYLSKGNSDKVFFIRKPIIKGSSIRLDNDVYELWYDDYKEAKLLTLTEILNTDILIQSINELIVKYSKFD
jgi:hypothetical protein